MGSRTPSNDSTEEVATALITEAQIDIDLSDTALSPLEEDGMIAIPTTSAEEYAEDILDFDDDELAPTNNVVKSATAEEQATSAQAPDASRLQNAKLGMAWSAEMMLTQSPNLASALHLHHVGDAITVQVSVHGVTYDVCWTIAAITSEPSTASAPAPKPAPKPPTHSAIKCKFGRFCKTGSACAFDHSTKSKLCIWVNTPTGCAKGGECKFSHECEDGGKEKDDATRCAGKKRGHEVEEDGTPKKQRLDYDNANRGGKQHHGRGRGRGNGRERGRGRGGAQGIRVRGGANKGTE
jgi:hypothetical protein